MKLFKGLSKHDLLYGGLISTFIVLYAATAFVSWYHAITFFNIANAMWLSLILSFVAEIGQASVLFSILLTELKKFSHVLLSWTVMVLLTTLQVIGNVVSSYEWITTHGGAGVEAFQKSILFWMAAADSEIFKVVIAWITGALLPIIALSMTALVAQYMELKAENVKTHLDVDEIKQVTPGPTEPTPGPIEPTPDSIPADVIVSEVSRVRLTDEELNDLDELLKNKKPIKKIPPEDVSIEPPIEREKDRHPLGPTDEELTNVEKWKKEQKELLDNLIAQNEVKDLNLKNEIDQEVLGEEIPPIDDQLTDEELEDFLSLNDEDVLNHIDDEINLDDQDRKDVIDFLDDDAEALTPEIAQNPIIDIKHNHGLVEGLTSNLGESIEIISPPQNNTEDKSEEKKRPEEQRLEKIRRLAREQEELKKK